MERVDPDILFFFSGRPAELELYLLFEERVLAECPGARVKASKTQISFADRYNFAFASLPTRKVKGRPDRYIIVTFGLGYRKASPRIAVSVEPYPNRWTHHVVVSEAAQLDGELMGWIREARDFSAAKR